MINTGEHVSKRLLLLLPGEIIFYDILRRFNEFSGARKSSSGIPRWKSYSRRRVPLTEASTYNYNKLYDPDEIKKNNDERKYIYTSVTRIKENTERDRFGADVFVFFFVFTEDVVIIIPET